MKLTITGMIGMCVSAYIAVRTQPNGIAVLAAWCFAIVFLAGIWEIISSLISKFKSK